jgi:hypothetical protein
MSQKQYNKGFKDGQTEIRNPQKTSFLETFAKDVGRWALPPAYNKGVEKGRRAALKKSRWW